MEFELQSTGGQIRQPTLGEQLKPTLLCSAWASCPTETRISASSDILARHGRPTPGAPTQGWFWSPGCLDLSVSGDISSCQNSEQEGRGAAGGQW